MDRYPFQDTDLADARSGEIEEPAGGVGRVGGANRRIGMRLPGALPGALGAVLLVGAIAFGASTVGPAGLTGDRTKAPAIADGGSSAGGASGQDQGGGDAALGQYGGGGDRSGDGDHPGTDEKPGSDETAKPGDEPTAEPTAKPEPTPKPTPKPTAKPEPTPEPKPDTMGLTLRNVDAGVKVDWTGCDVGGFDYYKIVRSKDSTVRWPLGDYDALAGVVENGGTTAITDKVAPAGRKLWYRVFCVEKTGDGYRVLNSSAARAIETPAAEPRPTPDPVAMGFSVEVTADGVALSWEACGTDGFRYYKVVRSQGANPSYFPWTDGTELIGVIEDSGVTSKVDGAVESGQTWSYRIQSIGSLDGAKVLLGQTAAIQVTIP